ncbi:GNAT family N-acetyltransferase [Nocardiopsis trehalosi]|uniref:GNAT family N-acetyltransferase n=1 Tax=Nocardiopsis trehalosi TaxID=109329 RepID=UPI000835FA81|nr:GNAT family N-acetyltransferase [Nocardiopsis trehalosi]
MSHPAEETAPTGPGPHPAEEAVRGPVRLRRWRRADAGLVHEAVTSSLDHLRPWQPWSAEYDRAAALEFVTGSERAWAEGTAYNYAVLVDGAVAGSAGLMRRIGPGGLEIGYWLRADRTGRGYATRAAEALVRVAFALPGVDRVEIHHDAANTASGAVARRLGMECLGDRPARPFPAAPAATGVDTVWRLTRPTP